MVIMLTDSGSVGAANGSRSEFGEEFMESASEMANRVLMEECKQDFKLAAEVCNRKKKSQKVVQIRRAILLRLRSPDGGAKPLSFPQIAKNLGGNHSAWVKMSNLLKKNPENQSHGIA